MEDRTTEIGGISNEERITLWKRKFPAISHLTSHFHVKCSLLTVMVAFIKKRLLNSTAPGTLPFHTFGRTPRRKYLSQNSEIQHLDGQDVMEERI